MVGNLDHKVRELNVLFEDCVKNYQDPKRFLTYLHSLLPALRHFTLAIQSNKRAIPDFEDWYNYWQDRCKADPILCWLAQIRTEVVHEDILAASSSAQIKFYEDYNEPLKVEAMNHMTSTDEMRARTNELIVKLPHLKFGNIELERSYKVTIDKKDYEVIDILKHCKRFMETIYRDLRNYLNNQNSRHLKPGRFVENRNREYAFTRFLISDGMVGEYGTTEIKMGKPSKKAVKERYKDHPPLDFSEPNDKKFIKMLHPYAEYLLKTDGYHRPMIFTKTGGVWQLPAGVEFKNRAEKVWFWHSFAERVNGEKIEALAFVGEQWVYGDFDKYHETYLSGENTEDLPNKLESLSTIYASKTGEIEKFSSMIIRDKKGGVTLSKPQKSTVTPHDAGFLYPVFKVWGVKIDAKPQ